MNYSGAVYKNNQALFLNFYWLKLLTLFIWSLLLLLLSSLNLWYEIWWFSPLVSLMLMIEPCNELFFDDILLLMKYSKSVMKITIANKIPTKRKLKPSKTLIFEMSLLYTQKFWQLSNIEVTCYKCSSFSSDTPNVEYLLCYKDQHQISRHFYHHNRYK